jgi:hypothetical protein
MVGGALEGGRLDEEEIVGGKRFGNRLRIENSVNNNIW